MLQEKAKKQNMSQANADSAMNQTAGGEANAPTSDSNHSTSTEVGNNDFGGSGEAESSAQQNSAPSMSERVSNVGSPEDFEAMMAEVQQNPNAFDNPKGNEGQDTTQHPEGGQDQSAPQEGEDQEQDDSAAGESEVEGTPNPEGSQDDTDEEQDGEDKLPQFRIRPQDKVDAEAFRIYKAAEAAQAPVSIGDALELAKRKLGVQDPVKTQDQSPDGDDQDDDGDDPTAGITLSEAKQELKDLRKAHSQALRDGDLDEAADVMDKIGETEDLIEVVAERETTQTKNERQAHNESFDSSVAKATDLFPDFGNQKSEFYERCAEIDSALRETDDPRYFDANKPLMIAQMAARELNIAPMSKSRPSNANPAPAQQTQRSTPATTNPQQQSASPQPPRTEKPGQLPAASGASRTASTQTGSASLADQVATITNPEDFERLAQVVHSATR